MKRDTFIEEIENCIDSSKIELVDQEYIKANYKGDSGKNGIYFLYNSKGTVIYIGMVGNTARTSFYHRMYGHGMGAHKNKHWFRKCAKFRFKRFPTATKEDLRVIERLMIFRKGQPKYNDIGDIIYKLDDIISHVKEGEVNG